MVDDDATDEGQSTLVLGVVLVKLLLLHVLLDIVKQGLHSLREDQQTRPNQSVRDYFFVQLPDLEACIVASREEIAILCGPQDPVTICFSLLGLNCGLGLIIPYLKRLVLGVTDKSVGLLIEEHAGDVVLMTWYSRVLPGYFVGVLPQFDLAVIGAGRDEVIGRMEADPIAASFMPIQHLNTLNLHPNKRTQILGLR